MRRLLHLPRGTIRCDLSVCRHSRSSKKETGEPLGYLPQQIICFGSKKKVAKTEGHCLRISFHLNTVSLLWASVFDKIWMYRVVFHSLSGNIMLIFCKRFLCRRMVLLGEVFFFFLLIYRESVRGIASFKPPTPTLPVSLKWCLAATGESQCGVSPDGMSF